MNSLQLYKSKKSFISKLGLLFSEKKIILRNMEQTEILIHYIGIPSVSWIGKRSEFFSKPFRWRLEAWNSIPNHLIEEKNTQNFVISLRTIPQKIEMPRIPFQTISQKRKKTRSKPLRERKNFWKVIQGQRKTLDDLKNFFMEFCSVPFCFKPRNRLFWDTRNSTKGALFSTE